METRDKVRILLLNPMGQILLMRIEDPHSKELDSTRDITSRWITIGGGIEPGETLNEAARREAHEETGVSDIEVGKCIDYREVMFEVHGQPVLFRENYIVATTGSWALDDQNLDYSGWTEEERNFMKEMRWWSVEEIAASDEVIFPADLAEMMRAALA